MLALLILLLLTNALLLPIGTYVLFGGDRVAGGVIFSVSLAAAAVNTFNILNYLGV